MKKYSILVLFFCMMIMSPAISQQKFGVVGTDEIYALMPEYKKADSVLMAFQQSLTKEYQEHENELYAAMDKFTKDSATMSPAVKEAKRVDLQNRIAQLQNKQDDLNKMLENKKLELQNSVRDKLALAIEAVAKEKGYSLVFYKESVAYMGAVDDLTPVVKKKLGLK